MSLVNLRNKKCRDRVSPTSKSRLLKQKAGLLDLRMGYRVDAGEKRESFVNVRVRLQRLADAKFFAGWVRTLSDTEIVVDFAGAEDFEIGSKFFVTINGVQTAAVVQATLENQSPGFVTLRYDGVLRYLAPSEAARRQVTGLTGVIGLDGTEIEMQVTDVSSMGFGAVIEGSLTRGTIVDIEVDTQFGNISGKAEVRYCRQDTQDSMKHRIGVLLTQLGRIETARWSRLIAEGVI